MKASITSSQQPIGVFDSGIGGLTALRKLAELLPHENLLYLGDTARVPYGNRSVDTIVNYSQECIRFLLKYSVKQILVACNTVSAVALPVLEELSTVPVVGVIRPAVNLVLDKKYQRVGVIGTRTTIQSCSYETEILTRSNNSGRSILVYSQACPLFVPVIEEGWETDAIAHTIAEKYLKEIKDANVEALILGCTHYSFLAPILHTLLPGVDLIDSGEEAANLIAQRNPVIPNSQEYPPRKIECYVTDLTPTFVHLAQQFLGLSSEVLHQTDL